MIAEGRFNRQVRFTGWGDKGQKALEKTRILVIGGGALGSYLCSGLARAGVGFLRLVDRDFATLDNLHRHDLLDEEDVRQGIPKVEAMGKKLARINSGLELDARFVDFNSFNALSLAEDIDLILDATDNLETRFLINDISLTLKIPWIYGSVVGSRGMSMVICPGESACLRCLLPRIPSPGSLETCESVGILNSVVMTVAGLQLDSLYRLLVGDGEGGWLSLVDLWKGEFRKAKVNQRRDCPACQEGKREFLKGGYSRTCSLCGRNAVQIVYNREKEFNLHSFKEDLEGRGIKVEMKLGYLNFSQDEYTFYIFEDWRVMVEGTTDKAKARSLVARYIGV